MKYQLGIRRADATHDRIVAAGSRTPDSHKTITVTFGTLPEGVTAYRDDDHHNTITVTFDADS